MQISKETSREHQETSVPSDRNFPKSKNQKKGTEMKGRDGDVPSKELAKKRRKNEFFGVYQRMGLSRVNPCVMTLKGRDRARDEHPLEPHPSPLVRLSHLVGIVG